MDAQHSKPSLREAADASAAGLQLRPKLIMLGATGSSLNLDTTNPFTLLESREPAGSSDLLNPRVSTKGVAVVYAYLAGLGMYPPFESQGMFIHRPADTPYRQEIEGESKFIHILAQRPEPELGELLFYGRKLSGDLKLIGVKSRADGFLPIALVTPDQDLRSLSYYISLVKLYSDHPEFKQIQRAGVELGVHQFGADDHIYDILNLGEMWIGVDGSVPFRYLNSPGVYLPSSPVTSKLLSVASCYLKGSDVVLDMGTGSGIIANFLAKEIGCEVDGIDINPRAVMAARCGALLAGTTSITRFWESDVFSGVFGKYDAIVSYPVVDDSIVNANPNIKRDPNRYDPSGNFDRQFYQGLTKHLKVSPEARAFIGGTQQLVEKLPPELGIINQHRVTDEEFVHEVGYK